MWRKAVMIAFIRSCLPNKKKLWTVDNREQIPWLPEVLITVQFTLLLSWCKDTQVNQLQN